MTWVTAIQAHGQSYQDLVFNQPVQATNANHSTLGDYYTGTTFDFLDVIPSMAGSVDMRVTVTGITTPRYSFNGSLPDYSEAAGQPGGDLGFLYSYTGGAGGTGNYGEGGVTYELSFFSGGGTFTDPYAIPDFRLMIYDIDGEPSQSESVMAFTEDGLVSYQLFNSSALGVSVDENGGHRFDGPQSLLAENNPSGAVILNYSNASSVRLQMIANTNNLSPNNNGVFGGIDGDLSLIGSTNFGSPVMAIPEPSVAALLLGALAAFRRRRRA